MANSVFSDAERHFLISLDELGVRYLLVGMSAALIQGARGATEDIDIWVEQIDDPKLSEAAKLAGGFIVSGFFNNGPPLLGGEELGQRFDLVVRLDGLESFAKEYAGAMEETVDGINLKLLPLERIVASKRAANRSKDKAQLQALEEALAVKSSQRK